MSAAGHWPATLASCWTRHGSRLSALLTGLLLASYPVLHALLGIYPIDDLLRHVVSFAWDYSHRDMFPMSSLPDYNLYPLFDLVVGSVTRLTDPFTAARIVSVCCNALMVLTIYSCCLHWARVSGARREEALLVAMLLLAAQTVERAIMGRPESWALAWALWTTTVTDMHRLRTAVLSLLGVVVSVSYWLAPLMFPLVLLADASRKLRLRMFVGLCAFHFLFWMAWTRGDMLHWATMIAGWEAKRPFAILEGLGVVYLLSRRETLLLWVLALCSAVVLRRYALQWGLHAAYLSSNLIRIGPMAFSCLMRPAVHTLGRLALPRPVLLGLSCLVWALYAPGMFKSQRALPALPRFVLPEGSRVLTPFNAATFAMASANPGRVKIFPPMEVGAGDPVITRMAVSLWYQNRGGLNCRDLWDSGITHVVESTSWGVPGCLRLLSRQDAWRLWEVRSTINADVHQQVQSLSERAPR